MFFCAYDTGGDFYIKPGANVDFGQTGRIHAAVHKVAKGGQDFLLSTYCQRDADLKAVEILDSNDGGLVIRVNTDLCEAPGPTNNYCSQHSTCPARDHIFTTLTLALGREHFAATAPVHQLTPGTKFDIDLYYRYGVPTDTFMLPSASSSTQSSDSSTSSSSATANSTTAVTDSPFNSSFTKNTCACSCEELADFDSRGEAAKTTGDNDATMALTGEMMACAGQCQREYMICHMQADELKDQNKDLLARQKATQLNCDCSCEALDEISRVGQNIEKQWSAGKSGAYQDIAELTQCFSTCQQEVVACAMKKMKQ